MKRILDHFALRRWLSAYLDSELSGERLKRMQAHLEVCPSCQLHLGEIRAGRELVMNWNSGVERQRTPSARWHPFPRWGWIAAAAVAIVAVLALRWWPLPSVQAMDVNFYAAQFRHAGYCVFPCTALVDTTLDALRASPPLPLQYPEKLPPGMTISRAIRYKTPRYEGVGLLFTSAGKDFWLFEQPQAAPLATNGQPAEEVRICGRRCTSIDCVQVHLVNWTKDGLRFVIATDLGKNDVESIVASLRRWKQ
ncbi:MAG TPA: zf-HC2 domain-containing protein [Bryobacteraceae bacterium]|nr:zf-HC2 domain-containing protein [Bryobacteraceae bacterium]